jgi:hypothetical protein
MGFMTILHGDNRFYNNIFIQNWPSDDAVILHDTDDGRDLENRRVGTWVFDDFPTYEEWHSQFDFSRPANMSELEKAHFGRLPIWAEGNIYMNGVRACKQEKKVKCRMVTSDILGKAFEPEQRFEAPDGSDLVFDVDYYGNKRTGDIVPGPFADLNKLRPDNNYAEEYGEHGGGVYYPCVMSATQDREPHRLLPT